MKLYTIGHSNHSLDKFISLLKKHKIAALVDSRTSPYSKYNRQFIFSEFPEIEIYHVRGDGNVFNARSIYKSVDEPPAEQLSLFE